MLESFPDLLCGGHMKSSRCIHVKYTKIMLPQSMKLTLTSRVRAGLVYLKPELLWIKKYIWDYL